jgi:hypothetical protein
VTERKPPQRPGNTSSSEPNDGERTTHPMPGGGTLTVNPEGGDDNQPRLTHPPAGQAVKVDPESGRALYPSDRPDLYQSPRPTDADGRRERE